MTWTVASAVLRPRMISTSFMTGTGLKKCMPANWSGRFVAVASSVMGMDEVLLAKITCGGQSSSSCR